MEENQTNDVELFEEVAGSIENYYDFEDDEDVKVFSIKNIVFTCLISVVALIFVFITMGSVEMICYQTTDVIDNQYIENYNNVKNVNSYVTSIVNLLNSDLEHREVSKTDVAGNVVTDEIVEKWFGEWMAVCQYAKADYDGELYKAMKESQNSVENDEYRQFYVDYVCFLETLKNFTSKMSNTFSSNSITSQYSNTDTSYKIIHYEYPTEAEKKVESIKEYNKAKGELIGSLEVLLKHFDENLIYKNI